MGDMTSAYLWCPAYPLADQSAVARARSAAQALARDLGWSLDPSPLLDLHPGPGAWLPVADRRHDLRRGLHHQVLLAARGGYGCIDLLPELEAWKGRLPLLIGFSDLTVLHAIWLRRGGPPGLYGFMPGVPHGERAPASARDLLRGQPISWQGEASGCLRPGSAQGALFPACLRVLASLVGTPDLPDLRGRILALEDVDERPYRVDRDLHQLARSGALVGVVGLVFGRFPCDLPSGYAGPQHPSICRRWAQELALPTAFGLPFGHEADPLTLPVGSRAELTVDATGWRFQAAPLPAL